MKALIIRSPWADQIVDGAKTIEYRSRRTHIRGRIAIIKGGTHLIIGSVSLVDCQGPDHLNLFHWILKNSRRLDPPVPYRHPHGAQIWVNLDNIPTPW